MKSLSELSKILVKKIRKTVWVFGLHAFSLIIVLIIIDIFLGGLIFYKYVYLAEQEQPSAVSDIIKFDEKTYQDVLSRLPVTTQSQDDLGE